jgi:hypothetical protein
MSWINFCIRGLTGIMPFFIKSSGYPFGFPFFFFDFVLPFLSRSGLQTSGQR